MSEPQVKLNEDNHNESIEENYISVCKKWRLVIHDYVWYKKAELSLRINIPRYGVHWQVFYFSFQGFPFDKNLIKNHSGEMGRIGPHWKLTVSSGYNLSIEFLPWNVQPLPDDPVFEGKSHCFAISNGQMRGSYKYQVIDLIKEGFSEISLDYLQPKIRFSEWISSQPGRKATYGCYFQLIGVKHRRKEEMFYYRNLNKELIVEDNIQSEWNKVSVNNCASRPYRLMLTQ